jgi:hypothetical protein
MQTKSTLGTVAIGGGLLLIIQAVAAAFTDQNESYSGSTGDAVSDVLLGSGLVLTLAALEALRHQLAPRLGALAIAGQAAIVIAIAATVVADREVLDPVYIAGAAAWLVGLIGLAVTAGRSGDARWRPAIVLPLAAFIALGLADVGGAALLGLVWVLLGRELQEVLEADRR